MHLRQPIKLSFGLQFSSGLVIARRSVLQIARCMNSESWASKLFSAGSGRTRGQMGKNRSELKKPIDLWGPTGFTFLNPLLEKESQMARKSIIPSRPPHNNGQIDLPF